MIITIYFALSVCASYVYYYKHHFCGSIVI